MWVPPVPAMVAAVENFDSLPMNNTFRLVYEITAQIPFGKVTTYGQIARLLGNPHMSRIVGCALHTAPKELPCRRVVNRFGGLSDAFEPMGKETHRLLLEMEGVDFLSDGNVNLVRHMWYGPEEK